MPLREPELLTEADFVSICKRDTPKRLSGLG